MASDKRQPDLALAGLRPRRPGTELKPRIMDGVARALNHAPAADLWIRLWESRTLRVAWTTAVIVLSAANIALTALPRHHVDATNVALPIENRELGRELGEILSLTRIQADARPGLGTPTSGTASAGHGTAAEAHEENFT